MPTDLRTRLYGLTRHTARQIAERTQLYCLRDDIEYVRYADLQAVLRETEPTVRHVLTDVSLLVRRSLAASNPARQAELLNETVAYCEKWGADKPSVLRGAALREGPAEGELKLAEARKHLEWAASFYCEWYEGKPGRGHVIGPNGVAYELVTAIRQALALLPSPPAEAEK